MKNLGRCSFCHKRITEKEIIMVSWPVEFSYYPGQSTIHKPCRIKGELHLANAFIHYGISAYNTLPLRMYQRKRRTNA